MTYESIIVQKDFCTIKPIIPKNYDKVDDGLFILKEIGLDKIRQECPHFNSWLTQLENLE